MAVLSRGTTITTTTTVTAQTLHDLIELAQIGSVTPADFADDVRLIAVSETAPNPTVYPFWYYPNQADPILRVFASPWNCWVAVGPHRIEVPLLNTAATTIVPGCLVVSSTAPSSFTIGSNPSLNAIGFLQSTCASGVAGGVAITGIGWVAQGPGIRQPAAGDLVHSRGVPAGTVDALLGNTNAYQQSNWSGSLFGIFLETSRSGNSGAFGLFRALIWGGRVGHQGGNW